MVKKGNLFEALCLKNQCPPLKKRRLNDQQEFFTELRKTMEKLEDGIQEGFKKEKSESLVQDVMQIHHEEMVQQKNCDQEYQILSQQLEVQIPETVYQ